MSALKDTEVRIVQPETVRAGMVTQVDAGLESGSFYLMSRTGRSYVDGPFSSANGAARAWLMTCAPRRHRYYVAQQV